ncbi:MarR family winged helix-turn-helix transcriptional regulator [Amycolatopsis sp. YIM 10]|uniref:MarR family winged helix-turn-helix transcriptional regulator n=1 Tax=Amycolatopsis sp. YIM 10 TaxID=2653857 RepID=UPI00129002D0|nr:MarR family transcriptional regulator [Amycolatopsis sp. YIM 10]QFU90217.1 transcriptional repressor MprA [Amycolatopsis sp. YIM 10]
MPDEHDAPHDTLDTVDNALALLTCVLVARRARVNPEGVTWQQYDVLELLRLRGPMKPSELGESLGVSRQTTSKALRVLKDQNLVAQAALGTDRREQTTSLTEAGHAFLDRAARSRRENAKIVEAALDPDEQAAFAALCDKVSTAFQEAGPPTA